MHQAFTRRFHPAHRELQAGPAALGRMDLVHLGLTSSLHIHGSGALTYLGPGEWGDWDEDAPLLTVEA